MASINCKSETIFNTKTYPPGSMIYEGALRINIRAQKTKF